MTEVSAFLAEAGYSQSIQEKGLVGLLKDWSETVKQVESGWTLTWEDYVNEIDGRRILDEVVKRVPQAAAPQLLQLDLRFRASTTLGVCIWGEDIAKDEGWDSFQHWYYYRHPKGGFPEGSN